MMRVLGALLMSLSTVLVQAADKTPVVEIYMPTPCLACIDWGAYLAERGFKVVYQESADMAAVKKRLKVPKALESVHTAVVGGYFVEGHAYAEDIQELLRDRPKARGIAVPGLPIGAPGREYSNPTCETACTTLDNTSGERAPKRELFDTLLVLPDGTSKIWARH
ncbi:MAG: metal-binding protein [Rhodocyclaceae bacterium]|nr:metal-binding protein [Dechloromonas sp.]TEX48484.1 MAG: metal-binding protein [Rhodocyclaceae bacterium]